MCVCFPRYYKGFKNIEGGFVHAGLVDLTGGYGESLKTGSLDPAVLWARLLEHVEGGDLLGAGSVQGRDTDVTPENVVRGHAYAILGVQSC